MALADEKFITLANLQAIAPLLEKNIPVMTMEYYEAHKTEITNDSLFIISDDSVQMSAMEEAQVTSSDLDDLIDSSSSSSDSDTNIDDLFN